MRELYVIGGLTGSQAARDFAMSIYINEFQSQHLALQAIAALSPAEKVALAKAVGQQAVQNAVAAAKNAQQMIAKGCYGALADGLLEFAGEAVPELMLGAKGLQHALESVLCFAAGTQVVAVELHADELTASETSKAGTSTEYTWNADHLALAVGCGVIMIGVWRGGRCQRPRLAVPAQAASVRQDHTEKTTVMNGVDRTEEFIPGPKPRIQSSSWRRWPWLVCGLALTLCLISAAAPRWAASLHTPATTTAHGTALSAPSGWRTHLDGIERLREGQLVLARRGNKGDRRIY